MVGLKRRIDWSYFVNLIEYDCYMYIFKQSPAPMKRSVICTYVVTVVDT